MRRFLNLILLLTAILLLSACSAGKQEQTTTAAATTAAAVTSSTTAVPKPPCTTGTTATTAATTATAPDLSSFAPNVAYEVLAGKDAPESALAMVIHSPSDEAMAEALFLQRYDHDASGEYLMLIPRFDGEKLQIFSLTEDPETGKLVRDEELFFVNYSEDGTAMLVQAEQDRDFPELLLVVTIGQLTAEYEICRSYDGVVRNVEYMSVVQD